jgi:GNAT superfamily N-acetyltransferase
LGKLTMLVRPPQLLAPQHQLAQFDCGKESLNLWLQRHARQAHASGSARTFVSCSEDEVVAYYSLCAGQLAALEAPERISKGMGRHPIPVILLARLAVAKTAQGQNIGTGLLQDAILRSLTLAEQLGIRAILTHPIDEAASQFYQRFGFIPSPSVEQQHVLLLKDARRSLG